MFQTKRIYKAFPQPEGTIIDNELNMPPPKTKLEATRQNKKKYLPGEKLAIKLSKQNDREMFAKQTARNKSDDQLNCKQLSQSLNRIISSLY